MKSILFFIYFFSGQVQADNASATTAIQGAQLNIVFSNHSEQYQHTDSVMVILDKYDHSGAGVIRKKFYPGKNHSITITGLPEGKYYATIRCMGLHRDYAEKIVRVAKQKSNTIRLKLEDCEEFSKPKVKIPTENISLARLLVVKGK